MRVTCSHCGNVFAIRPYRVARSRSGLVFCSRSCRDQDASTLRTKRPTLPPVVCPICGQSFNRRPAERRTVNYCSYACAAAGTGNLKPAAPGVRRSPRTEFRAGQAAHNRVPVGTVRTRTHRGDHPRAWVKVEEPNVWKPRAIAVWESEHGQLKGGYVVHHVNEDPMDDRLDNLEAVTRAEHVRRHADSRGTRQ